MAKSEVAAPKQTGVVSWQDELAALAVKTAEAEKPSGNWVSFKGGQLTIGGTQMTGNRVECVVIGSVFENQWYKERYDANNPTSPHCYAIAEDDDDLKPHIDSPEPQAATCAECPKNQWKSDPNGGKGKACKNVRRLALVAGPDVTSPDAVQKAEFALAKLPVTSVKNWSTYASQVANVLHLPPLAVKTEMIVTPDAKTQYQVDFSLVDKIEGDTIIQALMAKRADAHPLLFAGYDKPVEIPTGSRKF